MSATFRNPGNPALRFMPPMAAQSKMRGELADDPAALARWKRYNDEYREREAGFATANFRGFAKGERSTKRI